MLRCALHRPKLHLLRIMLEHLKGHGISYLCSCLNCGSLLGVIEEEIASKGMSQWHSGLLGRHQQNHEGKWLAPGQGLLFSLLYPLCIALCHSWWEEAFSLVSHQGSACLILFLFYSNHGRSVLQDRPRTGECSLILPHHPPGKVSHLYTDQQAGIGSQAQDCSSHHCFAEQMGGPQMHLLGYEGMEFCRSRSCF